jgi:uncharacterized DUF497 family protein
MIIFIVGVNVNFEWDEKKNLLNIKNHGISFEHATRVFTDPLRKEEYDDRHSNLEENRIFAIGVAEGRLLFVSFTEPDTETIRIISARKAKAHEKRRYYGDS